MITYEYWMHLKKTGLVAKQFFTEIKVGKFVKIMQPTGEIFQVLLSAIENIWTKTGWFTRQDGAVLWHRHLCHTYSITQKPPIQHLSGTLNELKTEGMLPCPSPPPPQLLHSRELLSTCLIFMTSTLFLPNLWPTFTIASDSGQKVYANKQKRFTT